LPGRGDDDGGHTAVIDDESGTPEQPSPDDASAPGRRPLPRPRIAEPSRRDAAASGLAGLALTVVFLLGLGISATRVVNLGNPLADANADQPAERVVFWTPEALANPEDPEIEAEPETSAPGPRSTAPSQPVATRPPASLPAPATRDTTQGAASPSARGEGLLRPAIPGATLPSPDRLGSAAATAAARPGRSGCAAPCREAAAVGMPGTELARRDSILSERMQDVVEKAGPPRAPGSIYFPLPFGGPTKEERQRDSTLHAEYRERLRVFMQRFDSAKADSLARGLIKP
jgi:hypothetical protein